MKPQVVSFLSGSDHARLVEIAAHVRPYASWNERSGRLWVNGTTTLGGLPLRRFHEATVERASEIFGVDLVPTYAGVAWYDPKAGVLTEHVDKRECQFTLDHCVEVGQADWPMVVDGTPYVLAPGEALAYLGCETPHHRDPVPDGGAVTVALFHFVERTSP